MIKTKPMSEVSPTLVSFSQLENSICEEVAQDHEATSTTISFSILMCLRVGEEAAGTLAYALPVQLSWLITADTSETIFYFFINCAHLILNERSCLVVIVSLK